MNNSTWFKIIAVLEMVGGGVGILFVLYSTVARGFALSTLEIAPIMIAIFVLSLIAGILLWKGNETGRKASIVVQFIQVSKFASPALIFMFSFGFDLFPHLTLTGDYSNAGIQFRFLSDGQLFLNPEGAPFLLGISIPALIAIAKLWNYDSELQADDRASFEDKPPGPEEYTDLHR
jgi:hypothetical protein